MYVRWLIQTITFRSSKKHYQKLHSEIIDEYELDVDPHDINKASYLEDMKEHRKELLKMHTDRPKLYALILQYLSEESADEIKRSDKYEEIDEKTDPLELWLFVEQTHKMNSISKVEAVTKMAARSTYQAMRQGSYESIITYKEQFNSALKAYEDEGNPAMDDKDIAMDFFRGLHNARYGSFKTEILNKLTSKAVEQPENLNTMYLLANQWLKTATKMTLMERHLRRPHTIKKNQNEARETRKVKRKKPRKKRKRKMTRATMNVFHAEKKVIMQTNAPQDR